MLNRKVEDLQFRVEEACITKGDLEVNELQRSTLILWWHLIMRDPLCSFVCVCAWAWTVWCFLHLSLTVIDCHNISSDPRKCWPYKKADWKWQLVGCLFLPSTWCIAVIFCICRVLNPNEVRVLYLIESVFISYKGICYLLHSSTHGTIPWGLTSSKYV